MGLALAVAFAFVVLTNTAKTFIYLGQGREQNPESGVVFAAMGVLSGLAAFFVLLSLWL